MEVNLGQPLHIEPRLEGQEVEDRSRRGHDPAVRAGGGERFLRDVGRDEEACLPAGVHEGLLPFHARRPGDRRRIHSRAADDHAAAELDEEMARTRASCKRFGIVELERRLTPQPPSLPRTLRPTRNGPKFGPVLRRLEEEVTMWTPSRRGIGLSWPLVALGAPAFGGSFQQAGLRGCFAAPGRMAVVGVQGPAAGAGSCCQMTSENRPRSPFRRAKGARCSRNEAQSTSPKGGAVRKVRTPLNPTHPGLVWPSEAGPDLFGLPKSTSSCNTGPRCTNHHQEASA